MSLLLFVNAAATTATNVAEDEEGISNGTAIAFAVVSVVVYFLFLRPTPARTTAATPAHRPRLNDASTASSNATSTPAVRHRLRPQQQQQQQQYQPQLQPLQQQHTSEAAMEILQTIQSKPPHVSLPITNTGLGGHRILLADSGLIQFSATVGNSSGNSNSNDTMGTGTSSSSSSLNNTTQPSAQWRSLRAKILAKLCRMTSTPLSSPPSKGSTIVISLPYDLLVGNSKSISTSTSENDTESDSSSISTAGVAKFLYALATFYNVVMIVALPSKCDNDKDENNNSNDDKNGKFMSATEIHDVLAQSMSADTKASIGTGTGTGIPTNDTTKPFFPVPSHRILLASTMTGRVALTRQLGTKSVALVIDFDSEIESQLTRFGYSVTILSSMEWEQIMAMTATTTITTTQS